MFTWKRHKDIFKGEGIYHLTFVVHEREPILGELVQEMGCARVKLSPIGYDISQNIQQLPSFFPAIKVCAKLLMPDHIHVVLWVQKEQPQTIKEVARSMRQGWHKIILAHLAPHDSLVNISSQGFLVNISSQIKSAGDYKNERTGYDKDERIEGDANTGHTLPLRFEPPFIRTLSRKGQLDAMIAYIHDNPRRAMLRRLNPDLFRQRREVQASGLTFTALGNLFLLDYPQRQAVECSRSANEEQIAAAQALSLRQAEMGAVTYSGAISEGERRIVRAIREAGFPMVVLLNEGFPAAGSEHERYYKPGGAYFEACAAGRLLLLEATADTIENPQVVALTEQALRQKAEAKHHDYQPLPHTAQRWRMMANNTIVKILTSSIFIAADI